MLYKYWYINFITILRNEIRRFMRMWTQTLLPPAITSLLYFLIFGKLMGTRIGDIAGVSYIAFIAPGLVMMAIITNVYSNVSSSFYLARFQRNIEEILVSPTPNFILLLGYMSGGIARGIAVGVIVTIITLIFTPLKMYHPFIMLLILLSSAALFSLAGFINGMFANSFDDIALIPTFILTPLTYLGGVFYSIHLLPKFWRDVSLINPIFHVIDIFRYSFLNISDINVYLALSTVIIITVALFFIALRLLNKGTGIKT